MADLSPTVSLVQRRDGYWLYDKTQGMNLGMREESERAAFLRAIHYYQRRLAEVQAARHSMAEKVAAFVEQFPEYAPEPENWDG